jgi:hypothetical protein
MGTNIEEADNEYDTAQNCFGRCFGCQYNSSTSVLRGGMGMGSRLGMGRCRGRSGRWSTYRRCYCSFILWLWLWLSILRVRVWLSFLRVRLSLLRLRVWKLRILVRPPLLSVRIPGKTVLSALRLREVSNRSSGEGTLDLPYIQESVRGAESNLRPLYVADCYGCMSGLDSIFFAAREAACGPEDPIAKASGGSGYGG